MKPAVNALHALHAAHHATGVPLATITSAARSRRTVEARRLACVLLVRGAGLNTVEAGRVLSRDHSTVCHHLNRSDELEEVEPAWAALVSEAARDYARRIGLTESRLHAV